MRDRRDRQSSREGAGERHALAACALVLLLVAVAARADSPYAVETAPPVSLRALVNARLVGPGTAPSWTGRGPGKTRYGGVSTSGGYERVTRFALSQLALEPSAALPWDVRAHAQLNWYGDVDDEGHVSNDGWPRLIEGWLRKEWGDPDEGWGLQTGVNNPPFAMESTGPAWTPRFSLTPSALNTWLWEEGRIVGVEGEWWHWTEDGVRLDAVAGTGWGPDQMGILLARRGWVLSDALSGVNSTLPLPAPGAETNVFYERDGRPAIYLGLNAGDPWQIGQLRLGYFDNLGDLAVREVWETRYGVAGVAAQPLPGLEFLFQALSGHTATRTNSLASTFTAWYPLLSYRHRNHRLTARYDDFSVHDDDGPPSTRERGHAVTVSYLFEFWLRHRIGFEYIWVDSNRPTASAPDPSDDGWQLSYRFRY